MHTFIVLSLLAALTAAQEFIVPDHYQVGVPVAIQWVNKGTVPQRLTLLHHDKSGFAALQYETIAEWLGTPGHNGAPGLEVFYWTPTMSGPSFQWQMIAGGGSYGSTKFPIYKADGTPDNNEPKGLDSLSNITPQTAVTGIWPRPTDPRNDIFASVIATMVPEPAASSTPVKKAAPVVYTTASNACGFVCNSANNFCGGGDPRAYMSSVCHLGTWATTVAKATASPASIAGAGKGLLLPSWASTTVPSAASSSSPLPPVTATAAAEAVNGAGTSVTGSVGPSSLATVTASSSSTSSSITSSPATLTPPKNATVPTSSQPTSTPTQVGAATNDASGLRFTGSLLALMMCLIIFAL